MSQPRRRAHVEVHDDPELGNVGRHNREFGSSMSLRCAGVLQERLKAHDFDSDLGRTFDGRDPLDGAFMGLVLLRTPGVPCHNFTDLKSMKRLISCPAVITSPVDGTTTNVTCSESEAK